MLPEVPAEEDDFLLLNSGAPALIAAANDQLVEGDESLNGFEDDDLAPELDSELDPFSGEWPLPAPIESLVPEPQPEAPEEPLPPAPAEGLPEAGPVAPKKSKAAPRYSVTGKRIADKVKHACERCQLHKEKCDGGRDGQEECGRCTRTGSVCAYPLTLQQVKKQAKIRAAPPPRVSKKRAPVASNRSTRRLRDILPRPEEPAPVNEGSAPGLGGTPQHSGIDRGLGGLVAGTEGRLYEEMFNRNYGGPVAGAEVPDHQYFDWNLGDFDAVADRGSHHLGGFELAFGALDAGSHGVQQYPQQANSEFDGYPFRLNEPLSSHGAPGIPFQGSAGPSVWTTPTTRRTSMITSWSDGTLPMVPGMDIVPQVEPAVPTRRSQQDRWEHAEADRAVFAEPDEMGQ